MPECYVRGNTIKYLRVPDEVISCSNEILVVDIKLYGYQFSLLSYALLLFCFASLNEVADQMVYFFFYKLYDWASFYLKQSSLTH